MFELYFGVAIGLVIIGILIFIFYKMVSFITNLIYNFLDDNIFSRCPKCFKACSLVYEKHKILKREPYGIKVAEKSMPRDGFKVEVLITKKCVNCHKVVNIKKIKYKLSNGMYLKRDWYGLFTKRDDEIENIIEFNRKHKKRKVKDNIV